MTVAKSLSYDVIVAGGGIAGSALAGVLARAGLGVLVVERERRFRDRIRGEATWPWGVAEARRAGLDDLLARAGAVPIVALKRYMDRRPIATEWELADGDTHGVGFVHPRLQEAAFAWAEEQGADTLRPAKAVAFSSAGGPSLTVAADGREVECRARLVVGADGKLSGARRWAGGGSVADPEHHRMGGVLLAGAAIERAWDNFSWAPVDAVNWFAAGKEHTRLYLVMAAERLRATGVDRSFDALVAFAAPRMPEGALDGAVQAGPIGFFPNNCVWAGRIAGNRVVLIGDAAGAPDPTQGHGTALVFHDVRTLSELLLAESDWDAAIEEFAVQRRRVFDVILESDRWSNVFFEAGAEAEQLREGHERARQHDPTLGGFALIETCGPHGLTADEAARGAWFGEGLA